MSTFDALKDRYPILSDQLPRLKLATLPTPVRTDSVWTGTRTRDLSIKYDNLTGDLYGGNKVRKLEYIFPRASDRHRLRVATFGAVGSNHALATALYARQAGFECTCFLSHQAHTSLVAPTLNIHIRNGTELIRYGGAYPVRLGILRESLWGRHTWVIPMGGSSWLGTVGFVAAGLELAAQIENGDVATPDRIYVGTGTMGTAVGLALGLALAGLETEVNAIRVSDASITNTTTMQILLNKTAAMMHSLDASIPRGITKKTRIRLRDEFFGTGYAQPTPDTDEALHFGKEELGLSMESTYTGKTIAAMLSDMRDKAAENLNLLYWHTYNSVPFDVPTDQPLDTNALPEEFLKYFTGQKDSGR